MKTGIVTWTTYNNLGTVLQAYALQAFLNQAGIENEIISDRPIIEARKAKSADSQKQKSMFSLLIHPRRLLKKIGKGFEDKKRESYFLTQQKIGEFKTKELRIWEAKDLDFPKCLDCIFDAFLCGSDQIWSTLDVNFDGYYYLNFTNKSKISYAPSLGVAEIPEDKKGLIRSWLKDYKALSVREENMSQKLSDLMKRKVEWVVDPTMLHAKAFWEEFADISCVPEKQYIICYFLENQKWYFRYAEAVARKKGMDLFLIPSCYSFSDRSDIIKSGIGPKEFLGLIQNAAFVLTDSFHATIFSLIFEKQFLTLQRFASANKENQNSRIKSLLGYAELQNHIVVEEKDFEEKDIQDVDYRIAGKKIKQLIDISKLYLQENLAEIQDEI